MYSRRDHAFQNIKEIENKIGFSKLKKLSIELLKGANNWQLKEMFDICLADIRYLSKFNCELQLYLYNRGIEMYNIERNESRHVLSLVA